MLVNDGRTSSYDFVMLPVGLGHAPRPLSHFARSSISLVQTILSSVHPGCCHPHGILLYMVPYSQLITWGKNVAVARLFPVQSEFLGLKFLSQTSSSEILTA